MQFVNTCGFLIGLHGQDDLNHLEDDVIQDPRSLDVHDLDHVVREVNELDRELQRLGDLVLVIVTLVRSDRDHVPRTERPSHENQSPPLDRDLRELDQSHGWSSIFSILSYN
jgi:hypothetical protein